MGNEETREREQDWNLSLIMSQTPINQLTQPISTWMGNQKKHLLLKKRKEKYLQINQKLNKKKQLHLQQMDYQRLKFRSLILMQRKKAQKRFANENDHHDLNPRG